MTRNSRKLAIPAILAVTVMVAGLFAFAPVEQASTVHVGVVQSVTGVQTSVTETIDVTVNDDSEFHQAILTATEPFTISDITVEGTMTDTNDDCDEIRVGFILSYPQEYGTGNDAAADAFNDARSGDLLGDDNFTIVDGDDDLVSQTFSMNGARANDGGTSLTFGPNSNVAVEIELAEFNCVSDDNVDFDVDITFHLNGITETDVDTSQVNDVGSID